MRSPRLAALSAAVALVASVIPVGTMMAQAVDPPRLTARGGHLLLDGRPYQGLGVNMYGANGMDTGEPYSDAQLDAVFSTLGPGTLVRTWGWRERGAASLKRVLDKAQQHHVLLVISLSEGAGYSKDGPLKASWYTTTYKTALLPWVDEVVGAYKNHPAVGMWEVGNELGNKWVEGAEPITGAQLAAFYATVARRIKAADNRHLVETGLLDPKNMWGGDAWATINADPNIDVMSMHEYVEDSEGQSKSGTAAGPLSDNYLDYKAVFTKVNKPIIMGESGINGADSGCRTRAQRVTKIKARAAAYQAEGFDAFLPWNVFPTKHETCSLGESIYPGDPYLRATGNIAAPAPSTTPTPTPTPSPTPTVPGQILDLTDWKLQLPVDEDGEMSEDCEVAEVEQPELRTYSSTWFRVAPKRGVAFRANAEGCTTSGSDNPRSELREMKGSAKAAWSATKGTHTMTLRQAVNHLPQKNPRVVVAQIHDTSKARLLIKANGAEGSGTGKVGLCWENDGTKGCFDRSYVLGAPYTLSITAASGKVVVTYNGTKVLTGTLSGSTNYFKAGAYSMGSLANGEKRGQYGEVTLYALKVTH